MHFSFEKFHRDLYSRPPLIKSRGKGRNEVGRSGEEWKYRGKEKGRGEEEANTHRTGGSIFH
jgi:hypothetical protein